MKNRPQLKDAGAYRLLGHEKQNVTELVIHSSEDNDYTRIAKEKISTVSREMCAGTSFHKQDWKRGTAQLGVLDWVMEAQYP